MTTPRRPKWYFYVSALSLYVADQVTKQWIVRDFWPGRSVEVIPDFLYWTYVRNDGIAFGLMQGNNTLMLILVTLLVVGGAFWARQLNWDSPHLNGIASLITAGALGNITDRVRHGFVIDFVDADLGFMRWPAFNVADSAICIAMAWMLFCVFTKKPLD
ncbi:MAG: signal peptidase II [Candidatus Methylacidiphilales bacterium]